MSVLGYSHHCGTCGSDGPHYVIAAGDTADICACGRCGDSFTYHKTGASS